MSVVVVGAGGDAEVNEQTNKKRVGERNATVLICCLGGWLGPH